MPGLQYLGEKLTCLGASILYLVMFCVTIIAGIIIQNSSVNWEKILKKYCHFLKFV